MEIEDPETGVILLAAGKSKGFQASYTDYWTHQRLHFKDECAKRKVDILELGASEDPAKKLMEFFERRKRR